MPTVSVLNTDANIQSKTIILAEGTATITGLHTFDRDPSAPFAVSSGSAMVTNFDADKLDGQDGSYYQTATNITSGNLPVAQMPTGGSWTLSSTALTLTGDHSVVIMSGTPTAGSHNIAFDLTTTIGPAQDANGVLMYIHGTFVESGAGTHALLAGLRVAAPTITNGGAATTQAATVFIDGQPTGATTNYALWIDSGTVRWDDNAAMGGGAAPTLGTIGGSGPATAAQNEWLKVNVGGNARFIPLWA